MAKTLLSKVSRKQVLGAAIIGLPLYGGYTFFRDVLYPTTPIECKYGSLLYNRVRSSPGTPLAPCWSDLYETTVYLPLSKEGLIEKLKERAQDKESNVNIDQRDFLSTFLTKSWLMSNVFDFEKRLLRYIGMMKKSDDEILDSSTTFEITNEIAVWTVVAKNQNEILFEFKDPAGWTGGTYLAMYPQHAQHAANKKIIDANGVEQFECKVCFGSASIEPPTLPLLAKMVLPIHSLYTRMLLVSTAEKLKNDSIALIEPNV